MVSVPDLPEQDENVMRTLIKEKERLHDTLAVIRKQIDTIQSEYPYTMKNLVNDPEQIAEKQAEYQSIIDELTDTYRIYTDRLKEMLR